MLDYLNILNGKLSIQFDKYNNLYTVLVDENTDSLVMDYTTIGDCFVSIEGNVSFQYGENTVLINTYCDNEENVYKLVVYKEYPQKEQIVFKEVKEDTESKEYLQPVVIGSCLIVLFLLFIIIFHKKNI